MQTAVALTLALGAAAQAGTSYPVAGARGAYTVAGGYPVAGARVSNAVGNVAGAYPVAGARVASAYSVAGARVAGAPYTLATGASAVRVAPNNVARAPVSVNAPIVRPAVNRGSVMVAGQSVPADAVAQAKEEIAAEEEAELTEEEIQQQKDIAILEKATEIVERENKQVDHDAWEQEYLSAVAADDYADYYSPILLWEPREDIVTPGSAQDQRIYDIASYKYVGAFGTWAKMAKHELDGAVKTGAPREELVPLQREYAAAQAEYMASISQTGLLGSNTDIDSDQLWFVAENNRFATDTDDFRVATTSYRAGDITPEKYQVVRAGYKTKQLSYFGALDDVGIIDLSTQLGNSIKYQEKAIKLNLEEDKYDAAARRYAADPSAENYYALEIAEMKLLNKESSYQRMLTDFVPSLGNLFSGNFKMLLEYQEQVRGAQMAKLNEKRAAEEYRAKYGVYPRGRESTRFGSGNFNNQNKGLMYAMLLG